MKIKLLKKIRRDYSIVYYPNGYDYVTHGKVMVLFYEDSLVRYVLLNGNAVTKESAYNTLYQELIDIILKKYQQYGTRRLAKNGSIEQLWYKKHNIK